MSPAISTFADAPDVRLHRDLAHAVTVLQLQQQLIEALATELAVTRAERDEARQIRTLVEALLQKQAGHERRLCRCGEPFLPKGRHSTLCQNCRSAHARRAVAARHAAATSRRAGQDTPDVT